MPTSRTVNTWIGLAAVVCLNVIAAFEAQSETIRSLAEHLDSIESVVFSLELIYSDLEASSRGLTENLFRERRLLVEHVARCRDTLETTTSDHLRLSSLWTRLEVLGSLEFEDSSTLPDATDPDLDLRSAMRIRSIRSWSEESNEGAPSIAGIVRDELTDLPIPFIDIHVLRDGGGYPVVTSMTDEHGRYEVVVPETGEFFVVASDFATYRSEIFDDVPCRYTQSDGCDDSKASPVLLASDSVVTGINFALDRLGVMSGHVESSSGEPLAGARVQIWDGERSLPVAVALTEFTGEYVSRGLWQGEYFATTHVAPHGFDFLDELYDDLPCWEPGIFPTCEVVEGTEIEILLSTLTAGVDFELLESGTITGSVHRIEGESPPVALDAVNVWVQAIDFVFFDDVDTNADGEYTVTGLPPATYSVFTRADEFRNQLWDGIECSGAGSGDCDYLLGSPIDIAPEESQIGIDFELRQLGSISGLTVDNSTGSPVSVTVVAVGVDDPGNRSSTSSDEEGVYQLTKLAPGAYHLYTSGSEDFHYEYFDDVKCNHPIYCDSGPPPPEATSVQVRLEDDVTGIDFGLDRLAIVQGTVSDAETGSPLFPASVLLYDESGFLGQAGHTDELGGYRISGILPGTYFAVAEGLFPYIDQLFDGRDCLDDCEVVEGTPIPLELNQELTDFDFEMQAFGWIEGRVTRDDTGDPIADVVLSVWNDQHELVLSRTSRSTGYFSLPGLDSGSYYLSTRNDVGLVDEVFDDRRCPSLLDCDPLLGIAVVVARGAGTVGVDIGLSGKLFDDDFESGDCSSWSTSTDNCRFSRPRPKR